MERVRNDRRNNQAWLATVGIAALIAVGVAVRPARGAGWEPDSFAKEGTLKLCTNVPDEGKYCFPVWLVVIDHQVYVRLGSKAADRFERSAGKPILGVEVAGQTFDHVRGESAPDYADRVGTAMAAKYTSDIFIHLFSHPLTLRLVPEG